jgi:hypothetical protein
VTPTLIAGWAIDPDTPGTALTVKLNVDGALYATDTADVNRPDIGRIYHTANHGYRIDLSGLTPGPHRLDFFAVDTATGNAVQIGGTRYVNTNQAPTGWVDVFTPSRLAGWAFDPNAGAGASQIVYALDGNAPVVVTANVSRPDLAGALGSADHGFDIALPQLTAGKHVVRVYTVDTTTDQLALLGQRTVTVASPAGNALPVGSLDLATTSRAAGWVWDASDPTASLMVRLDVDGVAGTPFVANKVRADVNRFVKSMGTFGFDVPLTLPAGEHRVDLYAMDSGSGVWVLMGSKDVATPPAAGLRTPAGALDVVDTTRIVGWAWSSGLGATTGTVRVDIDGVPVALGSLTVSRPDVAAIYGAGNFGFSVSTPSLPKGTHRVSLYLLDPLTLNGALVAVGRLVV